uniref:Uncharacterized protein n=1 Tax=Rhizophora mucronata TaxID=61149 RepID=A0A2P2J4T1_RHIMU
MEFDDSLQELLLLLLKFIGIIFCENFESLGHS